MVDTAKLEKAIVERSTTQQAVADVCKIDRSTLYRRLKSGKLLVADAKAIKKFLNLSDSEAIEIFLC